MFKSEKRKNLLLLVHDGPKDMEIILDSLKTTRQALLPQVRILEDHHLVTHKNDTYELTHIGELIVNKMIPLLEMTGVFEKDIDYWGNHNFDFIPSSLLRQISRCEETKYIRPHITELYELNKEFHEASKKSRSHYIITTFFHPNFPQLVDDLVSNGVSLYFIVSEELQDKLLTDHYENFKTIIQNESVHVFVCSGEIEFQFISTNDYYILLALLKNNGEIDSNYMLCHDKNAHEWGKEFFEHYLKDSIPITEASLLQGK